MKSYKQYVAEKVIEPSKEKGTLTLWHGGKLDIIEDTMKFKKGKVEYGPGLYLTTHWDTAQKYSKGGRKLYQVVIKKGKDAAKTKIPLETVKEFVNDHVIKRKQNEILKRVENYYARAKKITAEVVINIMINEDALSSGKYEEFRKFLMNNGIDYLTVKNPFGWGNQVMIVLFNPSKIVSKTVVEPKDEIIKFDLPMNFKR